GRNPQLIIGPWSHTQEEMAAAGVREGLAWLRAHLLDDSGLVDPAAVGVDVTGERSGGGWRELARGPPSESSPRRLWLAGDGTLAWEPPDTEGGSTRYRYDPHDPTPSIGGPIMVTSKPVLDNRELETRADVITFTSAPLDATV